VKRLLPFAPLLVCALLGLLFATYGLHHNPQVFPAALVGKPLPKVALAPLGGGAPQPLAQVAKGPVLVNVFASWCAPCVAEAPQLMALKTAGVPVVGVAYKDAPADTQAFLDRRGDPFQAILVDRSGDAGVEFGISGVPETFIVDAAGKIVAKHIGAITDKDVDDLTQQIQRMRMARN
jgi:cytochrome c biogenesis protein CcmG/thiol:disulfide interchange protein DsbE